MVWLFRAKEASISKPISKVRCAETGMSRLRYGVGTG